MWRARWHTKYMHLKAAQAGQGHGAAHGCSLKQGASFHGSSLSPGLRSDVLQSASLQSMTYYAISSTGKQGESRCCRGGGSTSCVTSYALELLPSLQHANQCLQMIGQLARSRGKYRKTCKLRKGYSAITHQHIIMPCFSSKFADQASAAADNTDRYKAPIVMKGASLPAGEGLAGAVTPTGHSFPQQKQHRKGEQDMGKGRSLVSLVSTCRHSTCTWTNSCSDTPTAGQGPSTGQCMV